MSSDQSETTPCERCDGDGWVEVFGDEGFPVGARDCEACGGTGVDISP